MGKKTKQQQLVHVQHASFSGPIPPPNILAGYDAIEHGLADRIMKMAERQSEHRQKQENKVIDADILIERLGMIASFLITIGLVIFGGYLISKGKDIAGYLSAFGPVIFQGGSLIYTKHKNKEDTKKR